MLDLRLPSGAFFSLLGIILIAMGILNPTDHAALTDSNVNLYCGVPVLAFGLFLLFLARRASRNSHD
ncbi:MAG TPA: hypothetical protein VG456_00225 [Candidatus Sulfopaludibacter sp.]|jgi:hypothetical protein|nr:hypothetical protein [Candidatus Sulfopaludibacter sp.]